jgi:hypothetical protein
MPGAGANPTSGISSLSFHRSTTDPLADLVIDTEDTPNGPPPYIPLYSVDSRPEITKQRTKKLGTAKDKYGMPVVSYNAEWRYLVGPPEVSLNCRAERYRELNSFKDYGLTFQNDLEPALQQLEGFKTFSEFKNFLNDPANAKIKEWLDKCLKAQYGRSSIDFLDKWGTFSERGIESWMDSNGQHRMAEMLDIFRAAKFYDGIALKHDEAKKEFDCVLSVDDPATPGTSKEISLYTGKYTDTGIIFELADNIPAEHRDRARVAMADAWAANVQGQNHNIKLTMGAPLDVMRLAELALFKNHMCLDLSDVYDSVRKAIVEAKAKFPNNAVYYDALLERWDKINELSQTMKNVKGPYVRAQKAKLEKDKDWKTFEYISKDVLDPKKDIYNNPSAKAAAAAAPPPRHHGMGPAGA